MSGRDFPVVTGGFSCLTLKSPSTIGRDESVMNTQAIRQLMVCREPYWRRARLSRYTPLNRPAWFFFSGGKLGARFRPWLLQEDLVAIYVTSGTAFPPGRGWRRDAE